MMFGGNKNDGISKPENENKSLEQQKLDCAYGQIKDTMQAFYEECAKQIKMSARDTRELYQEIDEKDAEIERLKQEKKAKDVLDYIGCSLAKLYNAIYRLPDGDIKKYLKMCIDDLNTSFRNAGYTPLFKYDYEPPKDPKEEDPEYEMTSEQTSDVAKIGKTVIDKVGFRLGLKPCLKMRYIMYQGDNRAAGQSRSGYDPRMQSSARIVSEIERNETQIDTYPFKLGIDFILNRDPFSGRYTISIKSEKMMSSFKYLDKNDPIGIGCLYYTESETLHYIDPVYRKDLSCSGYKIIIDNNVMYIRLLNNHGQNIGLYELAAVR